MTFPPAHYQKPDSPWIMQVPVISTGHFPKEDCDLLYADNPLMHSGGAYETALLAIEEPADNLPWDQLAETTQSLVNAFQELGYRYLRLDPDGDHIEGLPVFNW